MANEVRVAVAGAMGRMGTVAREALQRSGEYCCGIARTANLKDGLVESLDAALKHRPNVLLDLTTQPGSYEISLGAAERGLCTVVGASGWSEAQRATLATVAERRGIGALIVPNFSLGATLAMRFAAAAARFYRDAEIVEMHHDGKKDKPSGTALETAARIERETGKAPPIHSVRLPGLLAHQEVFFGGPGELLTISHDSLSRESFVAGMLMAVRAVTQRQGLAIGLDAILEVDG